MPKHDKWLRTASAVVIAAQMAACAGPKELATSPGRRAEGGILIADEPVAALAARDAFGPKGTAADAAVALGFALATTYPAAASLGGGGLCLYSDAQSDEVTTIEFLPHPATDGGSIGVPGYVRGFAELHNRFGNLPWKDLLAPARKLARDGFEASDAYVMRLSASDASTAVPHEFASLYRGVLTQGRKVVQAKLAATLDVIAENGSDGFYLGPMAETFVKEVKSAEGRVSVSDLAQYTVTVAPAQTYWLGETQIYAPSRPDVASSAAYGIWTAPALLPNQADPQPAKDGEQVAKTALEGVGIKQDFEFAPDLGTTGFITADQRGDVAVCALTMNGPFGARSMAADLGFPFGLSPVGNAAFTATPTLQPTLAVRDGSVVIAVSAGGSRQAIAVLRDFMTSSRQGTAAAATVLNDSPSGPVATLSTLICPGGFPKRAQDCRYAATRGGYGVAATTGKGFGSRF
jgi:gamma-glutamyltranspeptidase / glutathione hydrolase